MSLLSSERVVIGLAPEKLSALAVNGRFRPRLLDRHLLPLHSQPSAWDKGIEAMDALLAEEGWHDRDITVVLSNHYVRHAVVPAESGLSDEERLALAQIVFRDVFGDLSSDWELRVSPTNTVTTLASGVPRGLLDSLTTVCETRGRLYSIQTALMAVFNRVRRELSATSACLALVEVGRVTLASVDRGQWVYVDSRAGSGNILPQLLQEENELHKRKPGGILWLCDLTGSTSAIPEDPFWSLHRIEPPRLAGIDEGSDHAGGLVGNLALWGVE